MRRFLLTLFAIAIASPAYSAWRIDYPNSSITFTGSQAGTPFTGTFKEFTAHIEFDPTDLSKGHVEVTIPMVSATIADNKEQNEALPSEDWFFVSQFPTAKFTSSAFRETARGQYEMDGKLTIRDVQKPLAIPFTLEREGDAFRAKGSVIVYRNMFQLGGKQWADDKWIAYPVTVQFSILARAN